MAVTLKEGVNDMYYYDDEDEEDDFDYVMAMEDDEMESIISDICHEIEKESGADEFLEGGAVYYMNGNDGTDFDWGMNGRTCEFFRYYSNEMGAIKLYVCGDGSLCGYKWDDNGYGEPQEICIEGFLSKDKAIKFAKALYVFIDLENKWDEKVKEY